MPKLAVALLVILMAAGDLEARPKWAKIALRASQIALAGAVSLDLHSGRIAAGRGYVESNAALGQGFGRQAAILGSLAAAQIAVSEWAGRRNDKWGIRLGTAANFGRAGWHAWAAQHNYRLK